MKTEENFMAVDTPDFQGICAEAGKNHKLTSLNVEAMERRGCIALASIDKNKNIENAKRLLLIISTNVLNTDMAFENTDQVKRISTGTTPLLLKSGKFKLSFKNAEADKLKLWSLALDGSRIREIPIVKSSSGIACEIDTAGDVENGPSIYFEFAHK